MINNLLYVKKTKTINLSKMPKILCINFLRSILLNISKERSVFYSEADFQHTLGLHLSKDKNCDVRLETPFEIPHFVKKLDKKLKVELDIFLPKEKVGIELKYKTKVGTFEEHGETFKLKQHGAQNLARFDFFDDIRRLQLLKKHKKIEKGYAVFLTNDPLYWEPIKRKNFSSNFSMEDKRVIKPNTNLGWIGNPREGSVTRKRLSPNNPILIENNQQLNWCQYSQIEKSIFKYLIVEIK